MNYLLDTHVFLWLDHKTKSLSEPVKAICADGENRLFLSMVSVWEIQIKVQLGKLIIPASLAEIIGNQINTNQIQLLNIDLKHVYGLNTLLPHHKDPFDRLLIAQAIEEQLILLSDDNIIRRYPVPILW
jgi:PIN domain nuclease of toxin-antitoxin system